MVQSRCGPSEYNLNISARGRGKVSLQYSFKMVFYLRIPTVSDKAVKMESLNFFSERYSSNRTSELAKTNALRR